MSVHDRPSTTSGPRLFWRAVVKTSKKPSEAQDKAGLAWHLTSCAAPADPGAHCPEGQRLLGEQGDPDGHCLDGGSCPRCASAAVVGAGA